MPSTPRSGALAGVSAAVFPAEPERSVYNNAAAPSAASAPPRRADGSRRRRWPPTAPRGVDRYAAWVHEGDAARWWPTWRAAASAVAETTRGDGDGAGATRSPPAVSGPLEPLPLEWPGTWSTSQDDRRAARAAGGGRPGCVLRPRRAQGRADAGRGHRLRPRRRLRDLQHVHGPWRATARARRGAHAAPPSTTRGSGAARTASLQATPMAERVYARAGFRDLGRILEYGP